VRIIEAIVRDENSVLTVSRPVEDVYELKDVSLSLPSVVNRRGAVQTLELPLVEEEYGALVRSAKIIHEAIGSVGS
jgi:L-lactate dehydrogenase